MLTIAVGVVSAVILLVGFGFISTASVGWFFKHGKPRDSFAAPDKS